MSRLICNRSIDLFNNSEMIIFGKLSLNFMINFSLKILLGIALVIASYKIPVSLQPELLGGGIILIFTTLFVDGIAFAIQNYGQIYFIFKTKWLALSGQYIRFSMSYQYRIKVKDKYLLVKNSNPNWTWYQHVGGKYKQNTFTKLALKELEVKDDIKMKTHGKKGNDLAVFVPAKNAVKFINWFKENRNREVSHWREFYEELLGGKETQVLSKFHFPYVEYNFVKSIMTPLKKTAIDSGWDCWEVILYDVLDLLPNKAQLRELEKLQEKGDSQYIKWANPALINNLGHDDFKQELRYKIGPHAKWVLNLKWSSN